MRLHRFFVPYEIGNTKEVVINDRDLVHQLREVLRFTIGGQLILFDNSGFEYKAMISSFARGNVVCAIVAKKEGSQSKLREVCLFVSVIKKDKFEWVVEKGTELGVSQFVPVISDRSEKKALNIERAEKIIKEAAEQSGRATVPTISPVVGFEEALQAEFVCFAFHPKGEVFTIEHAGKTSPLGVFIGPEGGWTEREIFLFKKKGIKIYTLGDQILRAETASVAVSSLLLLQ